MSVHEGKQWSHLTVLNSTRMENILHWISGMNILTIILNKAHNVNCFAITETQSVIVDLRQVKWMALTPSVYLTSQASQHARWLTIAVHIPVLRNDALSLSEWQAENLLRAWRMDWLNVDESFFRQLQVGCRCRLNCKVVCMMHNENESLGINGARFSIAGLWTSFMRIFFSMKCSKSRVNLTSSNDAQATVETKKVLPEKLVVFSWFWIVVERATGAEIRIRFDKYQKFVILK